LTCPNQAAVLTNWAKQRGFEAIKIYEEEETAWRNGHQRKLANLVADARRRKFQAVLVGALDWLSREGALTILSMASPCGFKCCLFL
jgi:hypothetical protein